MDAKQRLYECLRRAMVGQAGRVTEEAVVEPHGYRSTIANDAHPPIYAEVFSNGVRLRVDVDGGCYITWFVHARKDHALFVEIGGRSPSAVTEQMLGIAALALADMAIR